VQRCIVNYHTVLQAAAQEGDTAPPALEDVVDLHFVALVNKNNQLVELDGRKSFPIDHGKTSDSTILQVHFMKCRNVFFLVGILSSCWAVQMNACLGLNNYQK